MPDISDTATPNTLQRTICTVGKVESGIAVLLTDDLQMFEVPSSLLGNTASGSVLQMSLASSQTLQLQRDNVFMALQNRLLQDFGGEPDCRAIENSLFVVERTHTNLTVGWPRWAEMSGTRSTLYAIDGLLDGRRLPVSLAADETTLRLSGLDPDRSYTLQLAFRSSAGRFLTPPLALKTAALDDLSCLRVATDNVPESTMAELKELGVQLAEDNMCADLIVTGRTHGQLTEDTDEGGLLRSSKQAKVPLVTTEWIRACKEAGRMQSVTQFAPQ